MKKIFYLVLCSFLLLSGCENLSQESKDSSIQRDSTSTQQGSSPEVDNGTDQKIHQETGDKANKDEGFQETNQENDGGTEEEPNQETTENSNQGETNQEATEDTNQGTNQNNNPEEIPAEKPDNYTGAIWVEGVTKDEGWVDVNKWTGLVPSTENNSCWMATSANVLMDYCRRKNIETSLTAETIYEKLYASVGDREGTYVDEVIPLFALENGIRGIGLAGMDSPRGKCLWEANCDDIQVMSRALIRNLRRGAAAIKFVWFGGDGSGHALTLWGAKFEEGILTKIYVTDSDDRYAGIKEYTVKTGTDRGKTVIVVADYSHKAKLREAYIPF